MVEPQSSSPGTIIIELHYLPCIEFFTYILQFDKVIIEAQENYQKQSYRNRCRIQAPNKILELSVPVLKPGGKTKIKETQVDSSHNWARNHWRSLTSSYGKAPFFEFFAPEFYAILSKPNPHLFDLNLQLLKTILGILGVEKQIELSDSYERHTFQGVFDARNLIHPRWDYHQNGYYQPITYPQIFGNKFAPNLSIIDLIFCEGTHARDVVQGSIRNQIAF